MNEKLRIVTEKHIINAVAGTIFEMSPYHYEEINEIIDAIHKFMEEKSETKIGLLMYHTDKQALFNDLKQLLFSQQQFKILNVSRYLRKQGVINPDDERNKGISFSGRGIPELKKEYDFIDLDACVRNITNDIWNRVLQEDDCMLCKHAIHRTSNTPSACDECNTCYLNPTHKNNYEYAEVKE